MRRQVLATDVRERLVDAADAVLGERFRPPPGRRPDPYDDGVVISAHTIGERCPRRATTPALDYVDSVATVRRRIGLLALRRAAVARPPSARSQRSVPTLAAALPDEVERTLADPTEWPPRLWDWVSSLSPPARAAVSAAVVTWCDGAVRLVGDPDRIVWSDPVRTPRWDLPGRSVALTAAFDARHGTPRAGERLLVLSDATSPSQRRIRAAHVALVHTLGTRRAPVRVTVGSPASGRMSAVEVDAALLTLASDRVVEHLAQQCAADPAPASPGNGCRHCHLLDDCPEGRRHLDR